MTTKPLDLAQFEGYTPGPRIEVIKEQDRSAYLIFCRESSAAARISSADAQGGNVRDHQAFGYAIGALHKTIEAAERFPAMLAECRRLQAENAKLREIAGAVVDGYKQRSEIPYLVRMSVVSGDIVEQARAALAATEGK